MKDGQPVPYGSWKSPITSDLIVSGGIGLDLVGLDEDTVYWTEARPTEAGRVVIVQRALNGATSDVIPPPFNARTRVHEYGGGAVLVAAGVVFFSNFTDQQLYRVRRDAEPQPLTKTAEMRYADAILDDPRNRLICVREDHTVVDREAANTIVSIDLTSGVETVLVSGSDFYSTPRLSSDSRLCWLAWDHPNMPWDGCVLRVASWNPDGTLGECEQMAGDLSESIFQPQWAPDGSLYFVSDRSGWWNLYRWRGGHVESLCPREAEFGRPQWVFGMSTYAVESENRLICTYCERGTWHLATIDTRTNQLTDIETPFTAFGGLEAKDGHAFFTAASPVLVTALVDLDLATGAFDVVKRSTSTITDRAYLSVPETLEFPTDDGLTAYAFFYAPKNGDTVAPEGEKPPLLVMSHGGPTAATSPTYSRHKQYWTSRGIAVLDVNYGGSTGYGRRYRERLDGQWGVVDVNDCINGARFLAERGLVDGNRLAITGESAGGYTALCALTFRAQFKAGASHFGIGDLEALVRDTHKFESRYLDRLIGPYPDHRDVYAERSPIHHADRLASPVIFFQGLDDKVVPPTQAESMVYVLRNKGVPVAYVSFEGEQHGFRRAANIKRAVDGEFYFYSRVFGFAPAEGLEPVEIDNL